MCHSGVSRALLRVIAFKNDIRGSFSLVMLNGTAAALQVSLNSTGPIPDSLEMRTTSRTHNFLEGEVHDGRSPITVPAKGLVSLGFRIRGSQPLALVRSHQLRATIGPNTMTVRRSERLFDLRGRQITYGARVARGAAGVILLRRGCRTHRLIGATHAPPRSRNATGPSHPK